MLLVDDRAVLGRISVLGIARRMPSDLEFKLRFCDKNPLACLSQGRVQRTVCEFSDSAHAERGSLDRT